MKFTIDMIPVAKGRPRRGRNGFYTPKKTHDAELQIAKEVLVQMTKQERTQCPLRCAVHIQVVFHMPIPKSRLKGKKAVTIGDPHLQTPDTSNLIKVVEDALNNLIWHDDCQTYWIEARKVWGEVGKIEIEII